MAGPITQSGTWQDIRKWFVENWNEFEWPADLMEKNAEKSDPAQFKKLAIEKPAQQDGGEMEKKILNTK